VVIPVKTSCAQPELKQLSLASKCAHTWPLGLSQHHTLLRNATQVCGNRYEACPVARNSNLAGWGTVVKVWLYPAQAPATHCDLDIWMTVTLPQNPSSESPALSKTSPRARAIRSRTQIS
jgi:hypothetical protein